MSFQPSARPDHSIWGKINHAEQILPGVWQVSTSSHGGIILSEERQEAMPEILRLDGNQYEEDVDWTRAWLAFEDELRHAKRDCFLIENQLAHDIARNWLPQQYSNFTGKAVIPNDSHVMRKIAAYKAAIGQIAVTAAWGDWADWVPEGKVGVVGKRVTGVSYIGFPRYESEQFRALADADRYDSTNIVNTFDMIGAAFLP